MASSTPSTPAYSTKSPTIRRILTEARELSSSPDPSLHASPLPTNIFEWHFTLAGPPCSPYSHGIYHGRIILPAQYPLRPPSFRFLTPSGRFEVNREICLSISGHHEESWQPAWGIRTALTAVRAFMAQGAGGQVGGVEMGEGERRRLAGESRGWRCVGCGGRTNEEVLREEGGWVGEGEDNGEGKKAAEASLPKGLKLGYRDELGADKAETMPRPLKTVATPPTPASSLPSEPISLSSAPIENSDSKAPPSPSPPPLPTSSSASTLSSQPTHATLTFTPTPSSTRLSPLTSPRPTTAAPLPSWIDKAIVAITVILVLMLLRKILT